MKRKRDLTRITINVPSTVLSEIDYYAEKNGISRTTAISFLCASRIADLKRFEEQLGMVNPGE